MAQRNDKKHQKDRLSSDIVWYQSILNRFNSVQAANNSIDTKMSVLLAGMIAVGIYIASIDGGINIFHALGFSCLIIGIVFAMKSLHVRDVNTEVHTTQEMEEYYDDDNITFTWKLINEVEEALKGAEEVNRSKAKGYNWVVYFFLFASILVIIGQIMQPIQIEKESREWRIENHRNHHDR